MEQSHSEADSHSDSQEIRRNLRNPKIHYHIYKSAFLPWGVVNPSPNLKAGGPPRFGCLRLFIQYIHRHCPYLEAVTSMRSLLDNIQVYTRKNLFTAFNYSLPSPLYTYCRYSPSCRDIRRNTYTILRGKPGGKRPRGGPWFRWKDNINIDLREIRHERVKWFQLAQDKI